MKEIVLAGGCFWGVEAYFDGKKGLLSTKVGYANGYIKNPTYEKVCHEDTGFAEACYISYDENIVSLDTILNWYWKIVDPTLLNRQGHDLGTQYRTGIYYFNNEDLDVIIKSKENQQKKYDKPIVTEVEPLETFYEAEEYHQKYLRKNPSGYCHLPKELLE